MRAIGYNNSTLLSAADYNDNNTPLLLEPYSGINAIHTAVKNKKAYGGKGTIT